MTFKCLYSQAPNYLIDLITIKKLSRYSLRSNEYILLELPGIKTRPILGDRAFQSAAPYLWNVLPSAIRNIKTLDTFKTAVKTHLFKVSVKENEVPTEKNSSRASIFATKASYISN